MPARPRRSNASTSYSHLLKPLSDSGSHASSSSDEEAPAPALNKGKAKAEPKKSKGKGKAKAMSDDDDTDGSVFEAEDASSEDDDDLEDNVAPSSDGAPGSEPDDDIATDADLSDGLERVTIKGKKAGAASKPSKTNPTTSRILPSSTKAGSHTSTRAQAPPPSGPDDGSTGRKKHGGASEREREGLEGMIPVWEPPTRFALQDRAGNGRAMQKELRVRLMLDLTELAFGPTKWALQDLGWWKGKWGETGIRKRWGGWYDGTEAKVGASITGKALNSFLPRQVYPPKPRKLNVFVKKRTNDDADEASPAPESAAAASETTTSSTDVTLLLGPLDAQELVTVPRFDSKPLANYWTDKRGHIANAGGPVYALAWAPRLDSAQPPQKEYLALATQSHPHELGHSTIPCSSVLQIWSLSSSGLSFEFGLCITSGEAIQLAWCPKGGESTSSDSDEEEEEEEEGMLGFLAGVWTDGSIQVYAVPRPDAIRKQKKLKEGEKIFVKANPVLKLTLPNTKLFSFAWMSHETIVAGGMNGAVAVWSVGEALKDGDATTSPIQYFALHTAAIRTIVPIRHPPLSTAMDGSVDLESECTQIVTASYDGDVYLVDLRDPYQQGHLMHGRNAVSAVAFDVLTGAVYAPDGDDQLRVMSLSPRDFGASKMVSRHRGMIFQIASSEFHPFVTVASADGTCIITSGLRAQRRNTKPVHYSQKLFRIDFNRNTGEYRMLDRLLPEDRPERGPGVKIPVELITSGAWPPEIGVLSTAWHPSMQRADLFATGMACGLVRIDEVGLLGDEGGKGGPRFGKQAYEYADEE